MYTASMNWLFARGCTAEQAADILAAHQQAVRAIASGNMLLTEARRHIREELARLGYNAGEDAGTSLDLTSRIWLDVSLQTNVDLARGARLRASSMWNIGSPGLELYRQRQRKRPRDWATRWAEAAQAVGWDGVASGGAFIALKTSPIWAALSRFGLPHPAFDFNSGMWVNDVDADACDLLGLLEEGWQERQIAAAEELDEAAKADRAALVPHILPLLDAALRCGTDIEDDWEAGY